MNYKKKYKNYKISLSRNNDRINKLNTQINKKYDNKYENFNYASQYVNFRHPLYYYFQITIVLEIGNYDIELNKQIFNSNLPYKKY